MAYSRPQMHHAASSSLYAWDSVPFESYIHLDSYSSASTASAPIPAVSRPCSSSSRQSYALATSDRHARLESASWDQPDLYRFDLGASSSPLSHASSSPSPAPAPAIKEEDTQDDFVLETPSAYDANHNSGIVFNTMTEVPLRATGATPEMRKLMGVFRLDPFTAHGTVRNPDPGIAWNGEPIGPLREKPCLVEFQLDVPGAVKHEGTSLERDDDLPAESSYGSPEMHRLQSPYPAAQSPCPSLGYPYDDSSSIDSHPQYSAHGSSKWSPAPLVYSPQLIEPSPTSFDTVITPAQAHALDQQTSGWGLKYPSAGALTSSMPSDGMYPSGSHVSLRTTTSLASQPPYMTSLSAATSLSSITSLPPKTSSMQPGLRPSMTPSLSASTNSYPSSYTSLPSYSHTQPQARSAYRTTSPVRLPPPVSSRYGMHQGVVADDHMSSHGPIADTGYGDDGSGSLWHARKNVALAGSYYGIGSSLSSAGSKYGLRA